MDCSRYIDVWEMFAISKALRACAGMLADRISCTGCQAPVCNHCESVKNIKPKESRMVINHSAFFSIKRRPQN